MAKNGFDMMSLMNNASKKQAAGAARYELENISLENLIPNPANAKIYETGEIEELSQSILLTGKVLQNVVVAPADEQGKYTIIAGHRRHLACQKLVEEGHAEFAALPCMVLSEPDGLMQELVLIQTNSTARILSEAEKMRQAQRATAILTELKDKKQISGRVRDIVAKMLNTTTGQLGRYNVIAKGLVNQDLRAAFESGKMGVTAAYEAARLDEAGQANLAAKMEAEGTAAPSARDAVEQQKKSEVEKAAEEAQDGLSMQKEYKADLKPKYKASLTITYEEKDGAFYSGYTYQTQNQGAGQGIDYKKPYKTSQAAIEGAMKKVAEYSPYMHKALWGSGFAIVGKPEEDTERPTPPKTEPPQEPQEETPSRPKVEAARAKFEQTGSLDGLTACEKCKITTGCEDCCRTCPPEKHCNVRQCEIENRKDAERITKEQEEWNSKIRKENNEQPPEDEPQEKTAPKADMRDLWLRKKAMRKVIDELENMVEEKCREANVNMENGNELQERILRETADIYGELSDTMEQEVRVLSQELGDWDEYFEQEAQEQ
ncbi:MAG: ParB N-terminal domain-containing protein [Selenomonadaceae bacterium]|nr:ParB N-terminal domain-containing protein [Selenomonadaceae bacterium]